ncbi:inner-membrane translocator, partial [Burkholderia sp. TJI49]
PASLERIPCTPSAPRPRGAGSAGRILEKGMAEMVLSQVANGLVLGFLYVLLAIGLSIICGLLGIVNFAHGALFALGAYFAIALSTQFGWAAVVLAPLLVAAVGV